MKRNKGVSLLERVFDKVLALVFLLAFLGVLGWQLTTGPGEVVVAGRESMPIDRAYQRVVDQASGLAVKLEEPTADPQTPAPPEPVAQLLAQSLRRSMERREDLPAPLSLALAPVVGGSGVETETEGLENPAFGLPELPGPDRALAGVVAGAMDPFEPLQRPEIAQFLPAEQPYDFRAATIEATFDPAQLYEAIEQDPDGPDGPLRPAPGNWWRARLAILDVQVQRQRLNEQGEPVGEPVLTAPAPGRASLRDALGAVSQGGQLDALVQRAQTMRKAILQPRFYNLIAGGPWRLPSEEASLAADREKVQQLLRRLQSVEQELASLVETAAAAQPGGGIGGGGGGQRPSRSGESDAKQRQQEREKQAEEARRKRIEALRAQIGDLVAQLKELGYDEQGQPLTSPTLAALEAQAPDLADPSPFTLWAFDVFVEPGARYRYRVRLTLANPLYGRESALAESARAFAASPVVHTQWSPWSAPVDVDRDAYLFVTRASAAGAIAGEASATVELYRFFYGGWRQVSRRVTAGDWIGAEVDLQEVASAPLPRFEVELVSDGTPQVRASAPITQPLRFDLEGAFALQVAPAPTTGRATDQAFEVVLRRPGAADVEAHDPRAASQSALRRRLQEEAQRARDAKVLEPGAAATRRKPGQGEQRPTERKGPGFGPGEGGVGG